MNRIFFKILLLLLLVISGILVWQWNIYSDQKSESNLQTFETSETISMSVTDRKIEINHKIMGLPAGNYVLQNIKNKKISCQEDEKGCDITNNNKLKTNGGAIKLTYSLTKSKATAYVLNNWAVQIKDVKMNQTQVDITHYGKNIGVWAAGANIIGQSKKGKFSYFVFEGNDGVFPLYYQNKELKKAENNGITVYGDSNNTVINATKRYEVKPSLTIVTSSKLNSFTSKYLLIRSDKDKIIQLLSNRYYKKNYPFNNKKEEWLQSLIGVYVINEKVEGKSKKLMVGLKQLSKAQQDQFTSLLKKNYGHEFSASYLDELLSEATGMKSNYFKRNKSEERPVSPFYLMNNAKWFNDKGEEVSDVESITMNSKHYYSLTQVAKHLGFKMEPISSSQIYLTNGSKSFRLYPGESTFLYNETAYSIKGELLKEINNKFYISEEYMLKIFNILVREQDNELQLISLN